MDTYIEVFGNGRIVEIVAEQRCTLTVTAKASKTEIATAEAGKLRNDVIRALKDAGLSSDEISEGGRETWHPWFRKKTVGQDVSHRVLLACKDTKRLYLALDALQPLFANPRFTLDVDMMQPRFEASEGAESAARATAIQHARSKAKVIAQEAELTLGALAQAEELASHAERSGAYGDYAWLGAPAAAGAMSAPSARDEDDFEVLEGAKRIRTLRFRVRFLIA